MKIFIIITMIIISSLCGQESQEGMKPTEPTQLTGFEKPIVSTEYILMPGDTVLVTVTGATNYSYVTGVTFEGKMTINMPVTSLPTAQGVYVPQYDVVAAIPVYGLSLKTAKDSLQKIFLKYFRNIEIDLTLLSMRTFIVLVVGEVNNPGMVRAYPIYRVSTVTDSAGGLTAIGSRSKIELRRRGKSFAIVNIGEFEKTGNVDVNPYVQDGDLIFVPKMEKSVIVKGAVFGKREYELRVAELTAARERTSEGLYELIEGERVADLIIKAGGLTPWADGENAYVERNENKIHIDLNVILADTSLFENIELEDGDVVIVPSVNSVVYVQGHVVNPGSYVFQPNLKASDYLGIAGGPLTEASMSGAYVQRGKEKISVKKDPIIEQGDRIFVPRQIFKFWQDYVEIGAVLASLFISYLTLTAK